MLTPNSSSAAEVSDFVAVPPKPRTYTGNLQNLPKALLPLTEHPRWVCWSWELRDGKWTKPPRNPNTLDFAKSNAAATWGSYPDAVAMVEQGGADGIGFMLNGSDIGAGDLDHCCDPETGEIDDWARQAIAAANGAYVEITPSGTGLRILGTVSGSALHRKFKIPNTTNGAAQIETYRKTARFITITGAQWRRQTAQYRCCTRRYC
jgi:primase-polymerase (primpol)-like protein